MTHEQAIEFIHRITTNPNEQFARSEELFEEVMDALLNQRGRYSLIGCPGNGKNLRS